MAPPSRPSSTHLEPPPKGVELEDAGAQESGSEDEHFSDASEGRRKSHSRNASDVTSYVPRTRVEKVDDDARHGEVPGTQAYEIRTGDAVPDEVEVLPEGSENKSTSRRARMGSRQSPVPQTQVERVDSGSPSHGEVPGTDAYEKRKADAVPDLVYNVPENNQSSTSSIDHTQEQRRTSSTIPETLLTRVETIPANETSPQRRAHRRSPSDALPDATENVQDAAGVDSRDDDAFGDEFDEFEEGEEGGADDDFGDFDDGFEEPVEDTPVPITTALAPVLDLDRIESLSELLNSTEDSLDTLFPQTKELSSLPPLEPIPDSSAIFASERSLSLWSQLVAPPPLQPPNWVKSRIRRLFLVSLGVPVDLDEILPASKQKKLVLPSINFDEPRQSSSDLSRSLSRLKKEGKDANASSTSVNSTGSRAKGSSRRRGPAPPPELDLSAVRRLCATTDAALGGLTDGELQGHVKTLEDTTTRASEVLEYWLKRRDGLMSEKEAFEGVIENLVTHARRVRK